MLSLLGNYRIWSYLAVIDVSIRYRRTFLGPIWVSLSTTFFILFIGLVYSNLFKAPAGDFVPFVAVGYILWIFISTCIAESSSNFIESAGIILEVKVNPSDLIMRTIFRNFILLGHNTASLVPIFLFYPPDFNASSWLLLPIGLLNLILFLTGLSHCVAFLSAKFRDFVPLIGLMLQMSLFITPILWQPKLISADSIILLINPMYYLLEGIRPILLGYTVDIKILLTGSLIGGTFFLAACYVKHKFASSLHSWV